VPDSYAAMPIGDGRWWLGIALDAPFGLAIDYDPSWFGRYDSIKTDLRTIDAAPSLAYRVSDDLSVGLGVDIEYAQATLSSALPDPLAPGGPSPATDGRLTVKGSDTEAAVTLGVLYMPAPDIHIGLTYRTSATQTLEGHATISGLSGPLAGQNTVVDTRTTLDLPAIGTLALSEQLDPRWKLLGELQWFGWSRFKTLTVHFADGRPDAAVPENYQDEVTLALGAEYRWNDATTLRAGFQYDPTPTTDRYRNSTLPDGDRYWLAIGASYTLRPGLTADFAFADQLFQDGPINVAREFYAGSPVAATATVNGVAHTDFQTLALGLRFAL
jgi:long-chain fatty acid transport protein